MGAAESTSLAAGDLKGVPSPIGIFLLEPIVSSDRTASTMDMAEFLIRSDPVVPRIRHFISCGYPLIVISSSVDSPKRLRLVLDELMSMIFTPHALTQAVTEFRDIQRAQGNNKAEPTLEAFLDACIYFVYHTPDDLKSLLEDKFKLLDKKSASLTFDIPRGQTKLKSLIHDAAKARYVKVVVNEREI